MDFLTSLKGYRTMIAAAVVGVLAVLQMVGVVNTVPTPDEVGVDFDKVVGAVELVLAVGFAFFRKITTGPVGEAE